MIKTSKSIEAIATILEDLKGNKLSKQRILDVNK